METSEYYETNSIGFANWLSNRGNTIIGIKNSFGEFVANPIIVFEKNDKLQFDINKHQRQQDLKITNTKNEEELLKKRIKKSKTLFNSEFRFRVDSPYDRYSRVKIDNFIKKLQMIWDSDLTSLNIYMQKFMPDVEIKRCGKHKDKFKFVTREFKKGSGVINDPDFKLTDRNDCKEL